MMSCNKKTLILAYPISTSILLALFRPWPQSKFYSFPLQFSLGFPGCLYRRSFTLSISGLVSLYYSWGCQHIPPNPSVVDQLHIFYQHIIHIRLHVLEHGVDQSLVRSSSVFQAEPQEHYRRMWCDPNLILCEEEWFRRSGSSCRSSRYWVSSGFHVFKPNKISYEWKVQSWKQMPA